MMFRPAKPTDLNLILRGKMPPPMGRGQQHPQRRMPTVQDHPDAERFGGDE